MENVNIRKASNSDRDKLIGLFKEFDEHLLQDVRDDFQIKMEAYEDYPKSLLLCFDTFTDKDHITLVAEIGDTLVGYITSEIKNRSYRVYNKVGYIIDFFVREEYRNEGLGASLMNKTSDELKLKGCRILELNCSTENAKSLEIYTKIGFKPTSIILNKFID